MTHHQAADPIYFLAQGDSETRRLIQQGQFYNPSTRWLLQQAGIQPGMKVLDVGSGSGDVTLLAREMVGVTGAVVGVDQNPAVLDVARARAQAAGYTNVIFVQGDLRTVGLAHDFDAVIGRFVLKYVGEPALALKHLLGHLTSGGIVAFQEMNLARDSSRSVPHLPLWYQAASWIDEAAERAGIDTAMGYRLRQVFKAAGFPEPQMHLTATLHSGPEARCMTTWLPPCKACCRSS
jgi:ubiquinone/menaquinone biosynthesis C-methylase UbiE